MIERTSGPSKNAMIDEETYLYFLEVLPPKFMQKGLFAFAEGAEELRLFWRSGGEFFCRQLSWDESKTFSRVAHLAFPYWF